MTPLDRARALLVDREDLRETVRNSIALLREHVEDGDCAGPDGTPRRGACRECATARTLERALARLDAEVSR